MIISSAQYIEDNNGDNVGIAAVIDSENVRMPP